jgi:hypothetical protein
VLVQVDGKSWERGINLNELANFMVEIGVINAINLGTIHFFFVFVVRLYFLLFIYLFILFVIFYSIICVALNLCGISNSLSRWRWFNDCSREWNSSEHAF